MPQTKAPRYLADNVTSEYDQIMVGICEESGIDAHKVEVIGTVGHYPGHYKTPHDVIVGIAYDLTVTIRAVGFKAGSHPIPLSAPSSWQVIKEEMAKYIAEYEAGAEERRQLEKYDRYVARKAVRAAKR